MDSHDTTCIERLTSDCGQANEDAEHFLLLRPLYRNIRQGLFGHLEDILAFNIVSMDSYSLCNLLPLGKPDVDGCVKK